MVQTRSYVTPPSSRKRARTSRDAATQTTVIYQGNRAETKTFVANISHTAVNFSNTRMNAIAQGNANFERNGTKVKVLRLEGLVRSSGNQSLRLTIYAPKNSADTLGSNLTGSIDRDQYWVLKDWWLHPGTNHDNRGAFFSVKLPMGAISEYIGATGTNMRKNNFFLRCQSTGTDTILGYSRCWYIDP